MVTSTVTSSGISALFFGLGNLDRTSAMIILLPGRYTSWKSYPCSLMRSRWRRGGALFNGLLCIVSRGLRSVMTTNGFPNRYAWNFWMPLTIASVSSSMFEYAEWAAVSVFDANARGLTFCSRQAPKPFWDASTSRTVSFRGL